MRLFKLGKHLSNESYILNLEPNDLVLESIIEFVKEYNIKNAFVASGAGTLKKLSYHRVLTTDPLPQNEYITIEGPFELASLQGLIIDYEPHIHFVASDLNQTYSGHLEGGSVVLYLGEVLIIPLENINLKRYVENNNVSYISFEDKNKK